MKKYIAPALVISIPTLLLNFFSLNYFKLFSTNIVVKYCFGIGHLLLIFFLLALFKKRYKTERVSGVFSFQKAFRFSFRVIVCWVLFTSIIYFCLFMIFKETMLSQVTENIAQLKEQVIARYGILTAGDEKYFETMKTEFLNPYSMTFNKFLVNFFFGTLFSLILSAFFKTSPKQK